MVRTMSVVLGVSFLLKPFLSSGKSYCWFFVCMLTLKWPKKRERHLSSRKIAQSASEQAPEKVPFMVIETAKGLLFHLHKRRSHLFECATTFGQIHTLHAFVGGIRS